MKAIKLFSGFFALLLLLSACDPAKKAAVSTPKDAGPNPDEIEVVFLQMNDVYEISPSVSDNSGGLARVATLRKELLAKNPNTFTVLAGDFISPSVIGTLKYDNKRIRGRQMVDVLNALGLDWVVFGNHEFDYDDLPDLQARIDESNFTWLGANVRHKGDTWTQPFYKNKNGKQEVCPDNAVLTISDKTGKTLRLGLFGVLINTGRKPWVTYTDWNEAAKAQFEKLKPQTDVVVALTHLNIADDLKLAAMLPEVPLMMGGHDHNNMFHKVGKVSVAKADANAKTVYIHTLRYNTKTKMSTVKSELRKIDASISEEPETAAVVAKWEKIKSEALGSLGFVAENKIATLKDPLDCREELIRYNQAPVGELLTTAMEKAARKKVDAVLVNSGSIRIDDVLSGVVTELDVVRMLPFGGNLLEVDMRGKLLRQTLETSLSNKGNGGYLQMRYLKRDDKGQWMVGNQLLQDDKVYHLILPGFLLTGNEQNMSFLKAAPTSDGKGTSNSDILMIDAPLKSDLVDPRHDIRKALIAYWRTI